MKNLSIVVSALLALSAPVAAQWSDDFEAYADGTVLDNVNGWFGWDNVSAAAGTVDSTFARSGSVSLRCAAPGADAVHPGLGATSGKWRLTAWQYVPSPLAGPVYLIVNNSYAHGGPYNWTIQLQCNGGVVTDDLRGGSQPLVLDQWVEFRLDIDLDDNTQASYYNGALVSTGSWTGGWTGGGGPLAIENIDLFSPGGTCFWDDIVLERRAPRDLVAFDADGDGDLDLATANSGTSDVSLALNTGGGVFGADAYVALTGADSGAVALAAGDLDNDGNADDLAVACRGSNTICTIIDPSSASPTRASLAIPSLANPADVAVVRLNGGGPNDLVVACEGTLLSNNGGLAVRIDGDAVVVIAGPGPRAYVKLAVCDLDGDGDNDVAAVSRHASGDTIDLFENDGLGGLTAVGSIMLGTTGFANGLCCGDLDGSNGNDLVSLVPDLLGPQNALIVHANTGSGSLGPARFVATAPISTAGVLALDVACGDFEDDTIVCDGTTLYSRQDLCVVNALGAPISHHGFTGTGFISTQPRAANVNPVACVVADLNGDGSDDLAVANQGSDDVTVTLTTSPALADPYGTGCQGTDGLVPVIGSVGLPVSGSATFKVTLSQARLQAPAALLLAGACANLPVGPCTIHVGLPLAATALANTDGSGNADLSIPVPVFVPLGADAYLQWAVLDPAGAFGSVLALSPGLHAQIGT